jgi:hypothetical protein
MIIILLSSLVVVLFPLGHQLELCMYMYIVPIRFFSPRAWLAAQESQVLGIDKSNFNFVSKKKKSWLDGWTNHFLHKIQNSSPTIKKKKSVYILGTHTH